MPLPLPARLRVLSSILMAGLLTTGATSTFAQSAPITSRASCDAPVLDLANPQPGDMLMPGGYAIEGTAFDPRAVQDSGVDRVSIFLDSRDAGGIDLGEAAPGGPNPNIELPLLPNVDAFNLVVNLPNVTGQHTLFAYARSSMTGHETTISLPVVVGEDPTKAGLVAGATSASNSNPGASPIACAPASSTAPMAVQRAAPTPTPVPAAPSTVPAAPALTPSTVPAASTPQAVSFELGNPSPGDTVHSGAYVLSGTATGVDRISFFLDPRDEGGTALTQISLAQTSASQFTATVRLPASHLGGHTLVAYAHSAVGDTETLVSVPIDVQQ
ncbi:MAG TPA: hypothetical protein VGL99_13460 [Chloroflexota bacterium]